APLIWIRRSRIRSVTSSAFGSAESMAFRINKVYAFTATDATGATAVQAHYNFQAGQSVTRAGVTITTGDRVPLTEISRIIAATAAIGTQTYTAEDTDEPEVFAMGAGSTLPSVYENW